MIGCQFSMIALKKWRKHTIFLLALFIISVFSISDAAAQANLNCDEDGFTNRIVLCIEDVLVNQVSDSEFQTIRDQMVDVVNALIVLYIVIFGYRVALGGVHKPMPEVVVHTLKISAVAYISIHSGIDEVFPMFKEIQKGLIDMVSSLSGAGGSECGGGSVWSRVDCLMASVLASDLHIAGGDLSVATFQSGAKTPYTLPSLVLGLATKPIGFTLVIIAVMTMVTVIVAFASAVVYYVMCLVAIIVLAIIAPIIAPTLLFESTKRVFDTWFQAMAAYIVQPAILFAYLAFMVHAMSIVVYGSGSGGGGSEIFGLHQILEKANTAIDDPNKKTADVLISSHRATRDGVAVGTGPTMGSSTDLESGSTTFPRVEVDQSDETSLIVNLIAVAMLAALLNSFMFNVMAFGAQLAGIPQTFSLGGVSGMFASTMSLAKGRFNR